MTMTVTKILLKDVFETIGLLINKKKKTTQRQKQMSEMIDRVLTSRRLCAWMDFLFIYLFQNKREEWRLKGKKQNSRGR